MLGFQRSTAVELGFGKMVILREGQKLIQVFKGPLVASNGLI